MTVNNELVQLGKSIIQDKAEGLWLPEFVMPEFVNTAIPTEADLYTQTLLQKYPLGAQLKKNGKLYRYGRAGVSSASVAFLHGNANYDPGVTGHTNVNGFEGALATDHPIVAGDTAIYIADTTVRAKNYYEGAELVVQYDGGGYIHQYRVIGSEVGTGTYVIVYIAPPGAKAAAPVSGTAIDAYMNRYSNLKGGSTLNFDYFTAMGACGMAVTLGYHFWLQTAGLITLAGTAGTTAGHRMVYPNTDGSVLDTEHVAGGQEVGYVTGGTISGYGSLLVMLTIDRPEA
jgi:hypothetical protein